MEKRSFLYSPTAIAAVALIAINVWLTLAHPLKRLPTPTLERGEAFNAISAYHEQSTPPDIVLLGSSLVTAPVMQGEAIFLQRPLLRLHHRRCLAFEKELFERLGDPVKVFCLAVGGEMASDAYLITKHLLAAPHHPAAIIYGIGPRDFQDNFMTGVDTSETFQVLAGLEDLPDLLRSPNLTLDRKVNISMERVSVLWRYRSDIKKYMVLRMKKLMEATLPFVTFEKYGQTLELKPQKHGQFPEEAKGELRAYPNAALDHLTPEQTCNEYFWRYNPISIDQIDTQSHYLEHFFQMCHAHGIKVLMVKMPLSQDNKSIMPRGLYQQYQQRLSGLCQQYRVELLDFDKDPWIKQNNFIDTVHLTPEVSPSFLQELSEDFSKSQVAVAFQKAGASLTAASRDPRAAPKTY